MESVISNSQSDEHSISEQGEQDQARNLERVERITVGETRGRTTNLTAGYVSEGVCLAVPDHQPLDGLCKHAVACAGVEGVKTQSVFVNGIFPLFDVLYPVNDGKRRCVPFHSKLRKLNLQKNLITRDALKTENTLFYLGTDDCRNKERFQPWFQISSSIEEMWDTFDGFLGEYIYSKFITKEQDVTTEWRINCAEYLISLSDVARVAKTESTVTLEQLFQKCIFKRGQRACVVCDIPETFVDSAGGYGIITETDSYAVSLRDKVAEVVPVYDRPAVTGDVYSVWVKRDIFGKVVCKQTEISYDLEVGKLAANIKNMIPESDETALIVWHANAETWEHAHYNIYPSQKQKRRITAPGLGILEFPDYHMMIISKMCSAIIKIVRAIQNGNKMLHGGGVDIPLPLKLAVHQAALDELGVVERAVYLSALEWLLYLQFDLSVPVEVFEALNVPDLDIKMVWEFWLSGRWLIERDYKIVAFIRRSLLDQSFDFKFSIPITLRAFTFMDTKIFPKRTLIITGGQDLPIRPMVVSRLYKRPDLPVLRIEVASRQTPSGRSKEFKKHKLDYAPLGLAGDEVDQAKILECIGLIDRVEPRHTTTRRNEAETQTD